MNETEEIIACIAKHGPIATEDVIKKTPYIRYVVDMVIELRVNRFCSVRAS